MFNEILNKDVKNKYLCVNEINNNHNNNNKDLNIYASQDTVGLPNNLEILNNKCTTR